MTDTEIIPYELADGGGVVLETGTLTRVLSPEEVAERVQRTNLATEFATFKVALDALLLIPNTAFTGAREVKDFARAARRMFRAVNRDLQQIDTGP